MSATVTETLQSVFNFSGFRPGQEQAINELMQGKSALAVFPTGSGKSLCYQLPALHFPGLTLVISPLIALMKDQIDFLHRHGVAAARLDSTLSKDEYFDVWNQIESGTLKLLYVSPERLANEKFVQKLQRVRISMMVVDEAHCMSEWGHNFRPDYLKLARLSREMKVERVLALTATATPQVADDIRRAFGISDQGYVNIGYYRPNLEIHLSPTKLNARNSTLLKRIQSRPKGATIVYVTLQRTAEEVAEYLSDNGLDATAYHAGLAPELRASVQETFMAAPNAIVVATIAFGMGIDKSNIRYVYHYNIPKSLENYAQEVGRAGRDGAPALCEVLVNDADRVTLENFTYGDTPTRESVSGIVSELLAQGDQFDISIYDLSYRYDMRQLVVSTLLCYLELQGITQSTGAFYQIYKCQFIANQNTVLSKFDPDRQQFLKALFQQGKKGKIWLTIDVDASAKSLNSTRKRITTALNYLEDQGLIKTQVSGVRLGYRIVSKPESPQSLADLLHAKFAAAEEREIQRIRHLGSFVKANQCTVRALLNYFGEDLGKDCGHCDRCLNIFREEVSEPLPTSLSDSENGIVQSMRQENHKVLSAPRQLAKFLCGIRSPAASRTRPPLSRHAHFGRLENRPFQIVLEACQTALQR